jgi:iron complex transport system substrate-binding protein
MFDRRRMSARGGRAVRHGAAALVVVALATGAAACGKSSVSSQASPTGGTGQGTFQPVTITDCTGVTSTYTSPPKRVANLTQQSLEMLYWLGVQGSIVGTQAQAPGAFPPQFDASVQKLPLLSGPYNPNSFKPVAKEVLLGANPDFVIGGFTSNFNATNGAASQADLTQLGINSYLTFSESCVSALAGPETNFDLISRDLTNLGKIFGVQQRAAGLVSQMQAKVADVQSKIKNETSKPSVFVFEYAQGTDTPAVVGNRQVANAVIDLAGGTNVFGDVNKAYSTTNWEEVIKRNPDVFLLEIVGGTAAQEQTETQQAEQFLTTYAPIQGLAAIKNKRFVVMIDGFDALAGPRAADGVQMLAKALYPAAFK